VTAEAANSTQPVTRIGTNSSYEEVMGLQVVEGKFISNETWSVGSRYVVLNEPAAFRLFGSSDIIGNTMKLNGEVWMVTGIVKDGKKKDMRVYVPSSAITGTPEALMAKTEEGMGAVRNSLRRLGIYEADCSVVDVMAVAQLFWQQFCVAIYFGIALLALLFNWVKISALRGYVELFKRRYKKLYLNELVVENRREFAQAASQGMLFLLGVLSFLMLIRQILKMALVWKDIAPEIKYLTDYFFQDKMMWLMRYLISGPILFSIFVIAMTVVFVSVFKEVAFRQPTGSLR